MGYLNKKKMPKHPFLITILIFFFCLGPFCKIPAPPGVQEEGLVFSFDRAIPKSVTDIPLPQGFTRLQYPLHSFEKYLQGFPLKKDATVYLYNGQPKPNQHAQFAVMNISIGKKDLQQCADAIMRLRAEYLYSTHQFSKIRFRTGDGHWLEFTDWLQGKRYRLSAQKLVPMHTDPTANSQQALWKYLEGVFTYCGTQTLGSSLEAKPLSAIESGDVFLKAGSPGHAVLVMDVAQNLKGQKIYLLAQSYMPAQNIHILKNPLNADSNPWYKVTDHHLIETPEWNFDKNQLYGWK